MPPVGALLLLIFCFGLSSSFVHQRVRRLGPNTYVEKEEQPWFRYAHSDHDRVPAADKESSAFGKHYIPPEDDYNTPRWTNEESNYLPCLTRECVCPFFRGNFTSGECHLRDGTILKKAHRQEIRTLSDDQRRSWEATLNVLKSSGEYNRLSRVHKYSGVHSGPAFTIWHREFLKRMELVIRRHLNDVNMGVPYWDSSLDSMLPEPKDSIMFSPIFLGEVDEKGNVVTGPYANWTTMEGRPHIQREFSTTDGGELLNNARIDWIIYNEDINMVLGTTMPLTSCPMKHTLDARMLEYSHDYVHFFIAGDMGKSHSSSNDVIFIYHHSMIDNIFEQWRQNKQTREQRELQYPLSHPDCFPPWHNADGAMPFLQPFLNKHALSNGYTDEMYEFAPRPKCTRENYDCGSKYLFCVVPEDESEDAFCMSKVKMGGNCTGYEGTPICYQGVCVSGVCQKVEITKDKKISKKNEEFFM